MAKKKIIKEYGINEDTIALNCEEFCGEFTPHAFNGQRFSGLPEQLSKKEYSRPLGKICGWCGKPIPRSSQKLFLVLPDNIKEAVGSKIIKHPSYKEVRCCQRPECIFCNSSPVNPAGGYAN
jgi:hypothetical protein